MRLSELLPGPGRPKRDDKRRCDGWLDGGGLATTGNEIEIRGLSADSRKIEPGFLFAALPGQGRRPRLHRRGAAKGAVAVLAPADTEVRRASRWWPMPIRAAGLP